MTAAAILDDLARRGVQARITVRGTVELTPSKRLDPETIARLRKRKADLLAELRRREWSDAGKLCSRCRRIGTVRSEDSVCRQCVTSEEWCVEGCTTFTVLERAHEALEARYGACLSCGGSCKLHGSLEPSEWRRVASLDDVELVTARLVIASAAAIVREARQ